MPGLDHFQAGDPELGGWFGPNSWVWLDLLSLLIAGLDHVNHRPDLATCRPRPGQP